MYRCGAKVQGSPHATAQINKFLRRRALAICRKNIFDVFFGMRDANYKRLFRGLLNEQIGAIHKAKEFLELLLDYVNLLRQNAPSLAVPPVILPEIAPADLGDFPFQENDNAFAFYTECKKFSSLFASINQLRVYTSNE